MSDEQVEEEKGLFVLLLETFTMASEIQTREDLFYACLLTFGPFLLMFSTGAVVILVSLGILGVWSLFAIAGLSGAFCLGIMFLNEIDATIKFVRTRVSRRP